MLLQGEIYTMVSRLFLVIGLMGMATACGGGDETPTPSPSPEPASPTHPPTPLPTEAPTPDAGSLYIEVVDQDGNPWKGVTLWVGSEIDAESATTGSDGTALLHEVETPYDLNAHVIYTVRLSYANVAKYNRIFTYPGITFSPVRLTLFRPPDYTSATYHNEVGGEITGINTEDQESEVFVMGGGSGIGMRPDADTLPWTLEPPTRPTYYYAVQTPVSASGYYDNDLIPSRFGLILDPTEEPQQIQLNRTFSASLGVVPTGIDAGATEVQLSLDWNLPDDRGTIALYDDPIPLGLDTFTLPLPPDDPDLVGDHLDIFVDVIGTDQYQETYVSGVNRGDTVAVEMLAVPEAAGYFPLSTSSIQGNQLALSSLEGVERTSFIFAEIWYQPTSAYGGYTLVYNVVSSGVVGPISTLTLPTPPAEVVWPTDTTDDYILARYAYVAGGDTNRVAVRYLPTSP